MQKRILIFGNSGSGKSTYAKHLCETLSVAHLDLDTLAWLPTTPPERRPVDDSAGEILAFIGSHPTWVIEGCYTDLLSIAAESASEAIWMNLPIEDCVANARTRPWEPHKYPSKEAQDANLEMLIDWIRQYETRSDTFSLNAHQEFYSSFSGNKRMVTNRQL